MTISPILPGRYAVVGSSGLQLKGLSGPGLFPTSTADGEVTERFVTPISRLAADAGEAGCGSAATGTLCWKPAGSSSGRRTIHKNAQQVLIGENGGPEFMRTGAGVVNVTDSDECARHAGRRHPRQLDHRAERGDSGRGLEHHRAGRRLSELAVPEALSGQQSVGAWRRWPPRRRCRSTARASWNSSIRSIGRSTWSWN